MATDSTAPTDPIAAAVAHFQAPLMRYATRIVGDRERAREIVQDTFVRLCEARQEELDGRLGSWLFRVCRNRAIDVRRKDRRLVVVEELPEEPVSPDVDALVSLRDVADAIGQLSPRERELLKLRYQEGRSHQEISELTGLSPSNVGFVLHRAVKSLRVRLAVAAAAAILFALFVRTYHVPPQSAPVLEHAWRALPARTAPDPRAGPTPGPSPEPAPGPSPGPDAAPNPGSDVRPDPSASGSPPSPPPSAPPSAPGRGAMPPPRAYAPSAL